MSKLHWKKQKTLAALANKRQWLREFDPIESSELEIKIEQGDYLITESSDSASAGQYR